MSERVTSAIGKYPEDSAWHKHFMGIALLSAKRSKDVRTQVGACIVNDEPRVVGTGYNGMPLDVDDSLIWSPEGECPQGSAKEKLKHYYVCHAELNAIINWNPNSVKGCTIYSTLFPCNECAKVIIKSGINRVVYISDEKCTKPPFIDSRRMLEEAKGIETISYAKLVEKSEVGKKMTECISFSEEKSAAGSRVYKSTSDAKDRIEQNVISWDCYFMALAIWSGKFRGEDETSAKEGACIVDGENRIVGMGCVQNIKADGAVHKYHTVEHAPMNAIFNRSPVSLKGCTLYTVRYPCNECVKAIIQSGIGKVTHLKEKNEKCQHEILKGMIEAETMVGKERAAEKMFAIVGIKPKRYTEIEGTMETLVLDFTPQKVHNK